MERIVTQFLLESAELDLISWEDIARATLNFMSEQQVVDMMDDGGPQLLPSEN